MVEVRDAQQWDVGFVPEPFTFTVTPELNQQYLFAVEDYGEQYLGSDGVVHPALLLNMSNTTRSPSHSIDAGNGNLHARDECKFLSAGRVGESFRVEWRVDEWYERKGRRFRVTHATVTEESGRLVLERRIHVTWNVAREQS
jgi:hypothetical protein